MSGSSDQFLQRLFDVDKDHITNKQLTQINSILARDDCQPAALLEISSLCHRLSLWLRPRLWPRPVRRLPPRPRPRPTPRLPPRARPRCTRLLRVISSFFTQ